MKKIIKFNDLSKEYLLIKKKLDKKIQQIINDNEFIKGEHVQIFEEKFRDYLNLKYVVGVANGTDALLIAIEALSNKYETSGEILVQPTTFFSSASMIPKTNNKVRFLDVDENTWQISLNEVENILDNKTVGIIGVHLYGNLFDVENISNFSKSNNVWLIEDCAQSHGAELNSRRAGSFGDLSTFSFYPAKNLGAFGDGGAIGSVHMELEELVIKLANGGRISKYSHEILGWNSRLDTIHAAVIYEKLLYLEQWNKSRKKIAQIYYNRLASNEKILVPSLVEGSSPVHHLFPIVVPDRDTMANKLKDLGIGSGFHYPIPLHLQPAFSYLGHKEGDFPISEKICFNEISIPINQFMSEEDAHYVCDAIEKILN